MCLLNIFLTNTNLLAYLIPVSTNHSAMGNLYSALLDTSIGKLEFGDLPVEMILMIFSRVGPEYHGVLQQVCRHWYHIVHGEQIHLARARLKKKRMPSQEARLTKLTMCPSLLFRGATNLFGFGMWAISNCSSKRQQKMVYQALLCQAVESNNLDVVRHVLDTRGCMVGNDHEGHYIWILKVLESVLSIIPFEAVWINYKTVCIANPAYMNEHPGIKMIHAFFVEIFHVSSFKTRNEYELSDEIKTQMSLKKFSDLLYRFQSYNRETCLQHWFLNSCYNESMFSMADRCSREDYF